MSSEKLIFAAADKEGNFYGEHLVEDLDYELNNLEYGDVINGEYQIWKYPSGELYDLRTDRVVKEADYYSTPLSNRGEIWKPQLTYSRTDKRLVTEAFILLNGEDPGTHVE